MAGSFLGGQASLPAEKLLIKGRPRLTAGLKGENRLG